MTKNTDCRVGCPHPTVPKGQPLRWKDSEPGAYDRTDVPEEIKQKYKYYYRDEKGNECYIAKDWQPSLDAMSLYHFGMRFEELAQYVLKKLGRCIDET